MTFLLLGSWSLASTLLTRRKQNLTRMILRYLLWQTLSHPTRTMTSTSLRLFWSRTVVTSWMTLSYGNILKVSVHAYIDDKMMRLFPSCIFNFPLYIRTWRTWDVDFPLYLLWLNIWYLSFLSHCWLSRGSYSLILCQDKLVLVRFNPCPCQ
jgi:hypothetical protein